MKQFLLQTGIILFVIAFLYGYHLGLNWVASIISWEGTAIGMSLLSFMLGVFIVGAGRLNKEYDSYYAEARIQGLEDQQKADQDTIQTLLEEREALKIELNKRIDTDGLNKKKARAIRLELTGMLGNYNEDEGER